MSIFAKASKSSFDNYDEYGSIKVEEDGLVLSAANGVHGTDGEGNATDTSSKKEKGRCVLCIIKHCGRNDYCSYY